MFLWGSLAPSGVLIYLNVFNAYVMAAKLKSIFFLFYRYLSEIFKVSEITYSCIKNPPITIAPKTKECLVIGRNPTLLYWRDFDCFIIFPARNRWDFFRLKLFVGNLFMFSSVEFRGSISSLINYFNKSIIINTKLISKYKKKYAYKSLFIVLY